MVRATLFCLVLIVCAGCSSKPKVVVGSKNFSEQVLLGEIVAQQIERRTGIAVERRLNLGGTMLAHEAVKTGAIDIYPEYTGTGLTVVLKQHIPEDPAQVLKLVRGGYKGLGLLWLDGLGFDNSFAMVIRSETAKAEGLQTLTDAGRRNRSWRLGVGYEFAQRPDGLDGLTRTYGLKIYGSPVTMELGLLYQALLRGQVEMAAANATDGVLARPEFTVLRDDRRFFPPYECGLVVREAALSQHSGLGAALEELSGKINDTDMRRLNAAVDTDKRVPSEVAKEFLGKF